MSFWVILEFFDFLEPNFHGVILSKMKVIKVKFEMLKALVLLSIYKYVFGYIWLFYWKMETILYYIMISTLWIHWGCQVVMWYWVGYKVEIGAIIIGVFVIIVFLVHQVSILLLASHHFHEFIKVQSAWPIFIHFFNDVLKILIGQFGV